MRETLATIPARYHRVYPELGEYELTFDSLAHMVQSPVKDPDAIARARGAVEKVVEGVVLLGTFGIGKTVAAVCIARAWAELGRATMFCNAYDLGQARDHARLGDDAPTIARAIAAEALLLDDLGREPERDSCCKAINEVLHKRHERLLPTIITSSLDMRTLQDRYGGASARRLFERTALIEMRLP